MNNDVVAESSPIDLTVDALDSVSYALVSSRLPTIRAVTIANNTRAALRDVSVDIGIRAAGTDLIDGWHFDLPAEINSGDAFTLDTRDVTDLDIDPAYLSKITESVRGRITVSVNCRWHDETRTTEPVMLLAANEWHSGPVLRETLAGFIQPNTNSVISLLHDASAVLKAATGSGALDGYQSGPRRAMEIASAIYAAIRNRNIEYLELPASFESTGQRVRTPPETLQTRFGNCIDFALLYCSALEHAGIEPAIWLTGSHALAGFFIEPMKVTERHPVLDDYSFARNLVDGETVALVETTALAKTGTQFADAVDLARQKIKTADFEAMLDIRALRRTGIRPLPSPDDIVAEAASDAEPESTNATTAPSDLSLPSMTVSEHDESNELTNREDDSPPRVRRWKKSLLDLSLRNPLLNLPRTSRTLRLHIPTGSLSTLEDHVFEGRAFSIRPDDDLTEFQHARGIRSVKELDDEELARDLAEDHVVYAKVSSASYWKRLKDFQRAARSMLQETGSN